MTSPAATPLVTYAWCRATGGALTGAERARLRWRILGSHARFGGELLRLGLQRVVGSRGAGGGSDDGLPAAPDGALTAAALVAARDQGPEVAAHGLRTWLFGALLARADGVALDRELLHVASIAHDAGMAQVVPGEDFTLRSADVAVAAFAAADRPLDVEAERTVRDAIVAHATAGVSREVSSLGHYISAGAVLDLAGLRLVDLPAGVVREVYRRHPQGQVRAVIIEAIAAEAAAVPDGRFAQLQRLGLPLAIRWAPHRHR